MDVLTERTPSTEEPVILIDSDTETDVGVGEERATSTATTSIDGSNTSSTVADDIDVAIIGERRQPRRIDSHAVVDLEHDSESIMNEDQADLSTAASADDVVIVQEISRAPRVAITLPGGQRMEVETRPLDMPMRSSFEGLQEARLRDIELARARRRRLFVHEEDDDEYDPDYNEAGDNADLHGTTSQAHEEYFSILTLQGLRNQMERFPASTRRMFDVARSLTQFRAMVERAVPNMAQEQIDEMEILYNTYRSRLLMSDASETVSRRVHDARRSSRQRQQRFRQQSRLMHDYNSLAQNLINYEIGNWFGQSYMGYRMGFPPGSNGEEDGDYGETQGIIAMIQEREDREHDNRTKKFMEKTKSQQETIERKAQHLPEAYSASFDTQPKMIVNMTTTNGKEESMNVVDDSLSQDWEEIPVCCLCGVELGVGIPEDYGGPTGEDKIADFDDLVSKYKFHCPYQSLGRISQVDRDLSKRTFIATCGHTFCGRCYTRINTARDKSKRPKSELSKLAGSAHPDNYGPKICPAPDCKCMLRTRAKMREAYF